MHCYVHIFCLIKDGLLATQLGKGEDGRALGERKKLHPATLSL